MRQVPKVQIYRGELEFISECVIQYPDTETGGDFFGFWSREGDAIVQYILGPGERTSRTGTSFFQDIDYLRECGAILHESFGLEHIGAWHSHHQMGLSEPSSGDVRTMRNALGNENVPRFLISICNIENAGISLGSFLFSRDNSADYIRCNTVVLPGDSPIRHSLRTQASDTKRLRESAQKAQPGSSRNSISFRLPDQQPSEAKNTEPEKPQFSNHSIWARRDGQQYLKTIYDKLKSIEDVADLEIKQLGDGRPAISFNGFGTVCEIRFPQDFPNSVPEVLVKHIGETGWFRSRKRTPQVQMIQKLMSSLRMLSNGDNRKIIIRVE